MLTIRLVAIMDKEHFPMPTHTVVACPETVAGAVLEVIPTQNFVMEHRPTKLGALNAIMLLVVSMRTLAGLQFDNLTFVGDFIEIL
jgi:hypothetical protein